MKTFILIIKAVLFYWTALITTIFLCGADSLAEKSYFFIYFITMVLSILASYKFLNKRDLYKIMFIRYLKKL